MTSTNVVKTIEDETDKRHAAIADALMVAGGVASAEVRASINQNPYRGAALLDIARASLNRAGVSLGGLDSMEIAVLAFGGQSNNDFPILLENAMHKTLQQAYATASDTWRRFCAVGSVSSFRDHPRYRLAAVQNLAPINQLGEFPNATLLDAERARVRIGTKGMIVGVSRHTIVDNDIASFMGILSQLGRAAARTIEDDVYALLRMNGGLGPVLDDGYTLFHVNHKNIGVAAAITNDSVDADRILMTQQKEPGNGDTLAIGPSILLVPAWQRAKALEVNGAEFNEPDFKNPGDRRPNSIRGLYKDIIDTPRLVGTRRYSFADPAEVPTLEVDFLNGNQQPVLKQEEAFAVDGIHFRVHHDFGVSAVDYRGAVTNPGL